MINLKLINNFLNRFIAPQIKRINRYQFNYDHKIAAEKAIKSYEDLNSEKLKNRFKKLSEEYAIDVFGGKEYAPWLNFYSLVSGEFKEGWIPDNYFGLYVAPKRGIPILSLYKTFSKVIFKTKLIPDLAYYFDGQLFDDNFVPTNLSILYNTNLKHFRDVIIKPNNSHKGRGILKIEAKKVDMKILNEIGDCVLQYPLQQHSFFEEITPYSDASSCVRIISVRNPKGEIEVRTAHLNLSRKVKEVFKFKNFIQIPINNLEGKLNSYGFTNDWKKWDKHPDTNVEFSQRVIPHFNEAVKVCTNLHASIPHINVIGWDISITNNEEVRLMEWNAVYPGIKLDEAVSGPCFTGLNWEFLWKKL